MGWKILGGRKVRSERKDGIGWECSGRVEGRGRSEMIGLETFFGVGEDVGWVKKRERVSSVRRVPKILDLSGKGCKVRLKRGSRLGLGKGLRSGQGKTKREEG